MNSPRTPRHHKRYGRQLTLLINGVYITAHPSAFESHPVMLTARRHNGRPWYMTVSGTGRVGLHRRRRHGSVLATLPVTDVRSFAPALILGHGASVADYMAASRDVINDVLKLIAGSVK